MLRTVLLVVGAAILAYLIWLLGLGHILDLLGQVGWQFLTIVVLYGAYQAVRAGALRCAVPGDTSLSYRDTLWTRLSGEATHFLTFTGPVLAEPTRAWLLKGRGLSTREAVVAVLTEYLMYTLSSAALAVVGLLYLLVAYDLGPGLARAARIILYFNVGFLIVVAVAIVRRVLVIGALVERAVRLPLLRTRLRVDMRHFHETESLLLALLRDRPGRFVNLAAIELAAQGILVVEVYWVLRTLALPTAVTEPFAIEAVTKFVSLAFFFIPTQVGAAEGAYAVVFDAMGLGAAGGFVLAFVRRLRALLVAGLGLLAMAWLTRTHRDSGRAAPEGRTDGGR
jgi:hypothetical protein